MGPVLAPEGRGPAALLSCPGPPGPWTVSGTEAVLGVLLNSSKRLRAGSQGRQSLLGCP